MAKVLFFVQLIVALVVLPLWPGLSPEYAGWGMVFLGVVLTVPLGASAAAFGVRATGQALADVWSPVLLGPRGLTSVDAWSLMAQVIPVGGVLGMGMALTGVFAHFVPGPDAVYRILVLGLFGLIWGALGLLLAQMFRRIVADLAVRPVSGPVELGPAAAERFGLTPRETEAAQAILDGLTYQGAADRLGVGAATVKSHILSVYQKTGAGNKIELLRMVEAEMGRLHRSVDGASSASGRS